MFSNKLSCLFLLTCIFVTIFLYCDLLISGYTNLTQVYFKFTEEIFSLKAKQRNISSSLNDIFSNLNDISSNLNETSSNFSQDQIWALSNLTEIIQERIYRLQFPPTCENVKTLRCESPSYTGFGSQMHFRGSCLIAAYITNRTWIPDTTRQLSPKLGWDDYFLPVTNCTDNYSLPSPPANGIDMLHINPMNYKSVAMPPAFPKEFAETLIKYHAYPPLFWVSQFQAFTERYHPVLEKYIEDKMAEIDFKEPMIGLHVRRGDKISYEALRFEVDEYMTQVMAWYNATGRKAGGGKRQRILFLTDDPQTLKEAIDKYTEFDFFFDNVSASKVKLVKPYNQRLADIISGIHMLSRCTFVVCTYSSNVCRLAYELAQAYRKDDSTDRFVSLDGLWYFWDQEPRHQIAIDNHSAKGDIDLVIGDLLVVNDNPWLLPNRTTLLDLRTPRNRFDGHFEGRNLRTGKFGRYPMSKVNEKWATF